MRFRAAPLALSLSLALAAAASLPARAADDDGDRVVLRFSTVGDSRQDPTGYDPTQTDPQTGALTGQDAHWLQDTKAFARILRGIQAQKPSLLFFNGDMIMGYGRAAVPAGWAITAPTATQVTSTDLVKFLTQYAFWRGMVAPVMETGTYVVPVPGNHEVQCNSKNQKDAYNQPTCPSGKVAQVENERAWAANMGDLIVDANRFQNLFGEQPTHVSFSSGADDGYATDQSKLSYSFDFRGSHFAVINTDPVGHDGHAPTAWLANDFAAAKARGIGHFFVFGHKPAYTYNYLGAATAPAGLDAADMPARDAFWDLVEQYGATYFCGHEHIYNLMQPRRSLPAFPGSKGNGQAWQVLVGSGGSPFEAKPTDVTVNPATDRDYAWATVSVHESGRVDIKAYGFSDSYGATRLLQAVTLRPGHED